jgi:signal transduction histidine kinase
MNDDVPGREVVVDGDAREQQKRLLNLVIGTIPQVVWWKDSDLRYTGCNEAYLQLRGLNGPADLYGRREDELGTPDPLGRRLNELERTVLDTGRTLTDIKVPIPGSARTLQFSVVPSLDGGRIAGVVGVGADISHVTELERQLAQANRLEAIGQLAAGVAHEINTPVQYASDNTRFVIDSVAGLLAGLRELDALLREPAGPDGADGAGGAAGAAGAGGAAGENELRERARRILTDLDLAFVAEEVPNALAQSLEGLERVAQIVRAMKEFSHPGQGRAPADLNRLVTSTAQVSRNEWKYVAELELDLDPAVGLVPCFEGDLKQVVLNIVVNAAHAIEERRDRQHLDRLGRIVLATRRVGEEVRITITDDGIGMDETTMLRVFDPFYTTKEVGKGTGQGLTLARSSMSKHGGRIEVTSRLGEGSTFAIVLPLKELDRATGVAGVAGAAGVAGVAGAAGVAGVAGVEGAVRPTVDAAPTDRSGAR